MLGGGRWPCEQKMGNRLAGNPRHCSPKALTPAPASFQPSKRCLVTNVCKGFWESLGTPEPGRRTENKSDRLEVQAVCLPRPGSVPLLDTTQLSQNPQDPGLPVANTSPYPLPGQHWRQRKERRPAVWDSYGLFPGGRVRVRTEGMVGLPSSW